MEITRIPFPEVRQLSSKDVAYATAVPELRPFFKYETSYEAFAQVIADKQKDDIDRKLLVEVLKEQYQDFDTSPIVVKQIESLGDASTFTVTTAHQPSLMTGPLYYIYKIFSVINLAEKLNSKYSDYHFVPIFITGGEDHDFEEVNHVNLFNRTLTWENDESGSVGKMNTASLAPVLKELDEVLGDAEPARQLFSLINEAYTSHTTYAKATIHLVNSLFKNYGLVILDASHSKLKRRFIPIIKKELIEQPSQALVETATLQLEAAGFSGQAYAREINLFYLNNQMRERILEEDGRYQVLNTDISFSRDEILEELENHPEYFSPNVVMRPLYQETILPNLAYIGGGGELAYWLERQKQFDHFGINFPMLIRRNSVLWIDKGSCKKMAKLALSLKDIFSETESLIKSYVRKNTENEISLAKEKQQLEVLYQLVENKASEIDPTLVKTCRAEGAKQLKSLEILEGKLMRAEKQRHEVSINQIRKLIEKLFPGNGLQERSDNFIPFWLKYQDSYFATLKAHLDPLESGFIVIEDK